MLCKQGVGSSNLLTSTNLIRSLNHLRCFFYCTILVQFSGHSGQLSTTTFFWKVESVADSLGFIETHLQLLAKVRIEFRHGLRTVRHPEVVDVFQTALATQPCFAESLERMPAHSFLI